jgi:molybdopterin synthase sulfur carrier subunit
MVRVKLFAMFREEVGASTVDVDADTVGAVLARLEADHDLAGRFLDDGAVRDTVTVMKNGTVVARLDGVDTPVGDGDRLVVSPPVTGG